MVRAPLCVHNVPMIGDDDLAWKQRGTCARAADPDEPFVAGKRAQRIVAQRLCPGCPVIERCLHASLVRREPYGVWGGLTEHQRANLLSQYPVTGPPPRWGDIARVLADRLSA